MNAGKMEIATDREAALWDELKRLKVQEDDLLAVSATYNVAHTSLCGCDYMGDACNTCDYYSDACATENGCGGRDW